MKVELLFLVVVLQLSIVYSTAPGDEDSRCVGRTYPENVKVLMDSRNYEELLPGHSADPIPDAAWTDASCDLNDTVPNPFSTPPYWQHGTGGLCAYQAQVCGYSSTSGPQDNWLFTQYISKVPTAADTYTVRVHVNITYQFLSCRERGGCRSVFRLQNYMTNSEQQSLTCNQTSQFSGSAIMPSNIITGSSNSETTKTRYFDMTATQDGFYFALQDIGDADLYGTCVAVSRLIIYRHECPAQAVGLVRYPKTPAPASDTVDGIVTAQCVPNAHRSSSSLDVRCGTDGYWGSEVPTCACNAGYQLGTDTRGNQVCEACPVGTFSAAAGNCTNCPLNTLSSPKAASICLCKEYYYRVDGTSIYCQGENSNRLSCSHVDSAATACTTSPSKPLALNETDITAYNITVTWTVPTEDGERDDIFYRILREEIGSIEPSVELANYIGGNSLHYTLLGLKPVTKYRVKVVAENGVSYHDNEMHRIAERTADIVVETSEGPPEKISDPQVVDNIVIVWGPPTVTNGVITGYHISLTFCRTSPDEGSGETRNSTVLQPDEICYPAIRFDDISPSTFFFVMRDSLVPDYSNNLTFSIAGRTGKDRIGIWSDPITFIPFAAPDVVVSECPKTITPSCSYLPTISNSFPPPDKTPSITDASFENCITNMGIAIGAGAIVIIVFLITLIFSCVIACLCHRHKMNSYKLKLKKEAHSKWDY